MEAAPQPMNFSPTQMPVQMVAMGTRPAKAMSFGDAMQTSFKMKYATFSGRASRSEFWWSYLGWLLIVIAAVVLDVVTGLGLFTVVAYLGGILPMLAVMVRRLHDTGRSGWMFLIGLIPLVGGILLLVWYVTDGQPMDNPYGAVPTNTMPL
jgi:uncharacterized membrane protein YhaH (DUF805 family)